MIWFRWAVPLGGGYDGTNAAGKVDDKQDNGVRRPMQSTRKCGVDVAPNSIQRCYWTDCFERLHGPAWGSRRRAAGAQVHADIYNGPSGSYPGCGDMTSNIPESKRRRMAGAFPHLAIQCKYKECSARPSIRQFRYWIKGKDAYKGLTGTFASNGTFNGPCPGGTQEWKGTEQIYTETSVKPDESWIWYGTQGKKKCIYKAWDTANDGSRPWQANSQRGPLIPGQASGGTKRCQCKTLICRVSTKAEKNKNTAQWKGDGDGTNPQTSDECNFMVRIEDWWASPLVPKFWMWNIFSISAAISLGLTGYYYVTYGAELVKEHEGGGSEGSGN